MNYSIALYSADLGSKPTFVGNATASGASAFVSILSQGDPELKYKLLSQLTVTEMLYLPPTDLIPYAVLITKTA